MSAADRRKVQPAAAPRSPRAWCREVVWRRKTAPPGQASPLRHPASLKVGDSCRGRCGPSAQHLQVLDATCRFPRRVRYSPLVGSGMKAVNPPVAACNSRPEEMLDDVLVPLFGTEHHGRSCRHPQRVRGTHHRRPLLPAGSCSARLAAHGIDQDLRTATAGATGNPATCRRAGIPSMVRPKA